MKITFVAPYFGLTGGNRVVATYADILRDRGHDVLVVSQPKPRRGLKHQLKHLSSNLTRSGFDDDMAYLEDMTFELKVLDAPRAVIDDDLPDADIVIATWWETAYWVASLSERKGRKIYFIQHHEVHDHLPWQISRGTYYLPLKKVTISKWLVDTMARDYGDHDVDLIHNSVDMRQFHAAPRSRQSAPTIGLLYSPVHFKGVDISLEAIEKVKQHIPDLKLIAFGAAKPVPSLPLPLETEYHLAPAQDTIRDIYKRCDVWLCGSRAEGFHLPPLEAMACRCPVVSTRVGGPMDIVQDSVNGYVVDVEDSDALADRLIRVLKLALEEWLKMSESALACAESYTWQDAADRFEASLKGALS